MDRLPPEGEPDRTGVLIHLLRREVGVDHRLKPRARCAGRAEAEGRRPAEAGGETAQRRLEQPVLVTEIMRDEARRDARLLGDEAERRGIEADLGHDENGGVDQLLAANIFRIPARHAALHR